MQNEQLLFRWWMLTRTFAHPHELCCSKREAKDPSAKDGEEGGARRRQRGGSHASKTELSVSVYTLNKFGPNYFEAPSGYVCVCVCL